MHDGEGARLQRVNGIAAQGLRPYYPAGACRPQTPFFLDNDVELTGGLSV